VGVEPISELRTRKSLRTENQKESRRTFRISCPAGAVRVRLGWWSIEHVLVSIHAAAVKSIAVEKTRRVTKSTASCQTGLVGCLQCTVYRDKQHLVNTNTRFSRGRVLDFLFFISSVLKGFRPMGRAPESFGSQ